MTDKKIKRLSREELLELLITSERENETLRQQLTEQEEKLRRRQLMLKNAGSIAEACLQVNHVMEVTQAAADQYLDSVKSVTSSQSVAAEQLLQEAQLKADSLLNETLCKCAEMESCAEQKVEEKWQMIKYRLEELYDAHMGLRDLVAVSKSIL
ncbi:MAG: hypothetical protein LBS36_08310 [Oscillospiraceae bacterium]|jgi:hypothetical protein|nr:hypothetical protein [Oscillospiraceae bacterium]